LRVECVIKKSPAFAGLFLIHLPVPDPGPVGPNVDPLGDALGPSVLPDGLWVLFGFMMAGPLVVEPAVLPVVVPFIDDPVLVPLAAGLPAVELPPAEPVPAEPLLCASANVLERANAVASAIVVSLMITSLVFIDQG
jgi:hypothetical protein